VFDITETGAEITLSGLAVGWSMVMFWK